MKTEQGKDHIACVVSVRGMDNWGKGFPEAVAQWLEQCAEEIRSNHAAYSNNFRMRYVIPSFTISREPGGESDG